MKWGVRRSRGSDGTVGGSHPSSSSDASRAKEFHTRAKKGGAHTLSNQELQHLVNRMNLEQNYARLTSDAKATSKVKKGHAAAKEVLSVGMTVKQAYDLYNSPMVKNLKK